MILRTHQASLEICVRTSRLETTIDVGSKHGSSAGFMVCETKSGRGTGKGGKESGILTIRPKSSHHGFSP